jgi:nicotinamidase/pyrazinamidase
MKVLVIVDYQWDFVVPSGSLFVKGADKILPEIEAQATNMRYDFRVATRDWHPMDHKSFKENKGKWPAHCRANCDGSKLMFNTANIDAVFDKGLDPKAEAYGALYDENGKPQAMKYFCDGLVSNDQSGYNYPQFYVCGVALDFCVANTAMQLARFGDVTVLAKATACIGNYDQTIAKLKEVKCATQNRIQVLE